MACTPTADSAVLGAREQEFSKYYHPKNDNTVRSSLPSSSHDVALTAFAQLGALRLNAKRCMISLFDRTQQYIIAEATRTLSLRSDEVYENDDNLWIGCSVLAKEMGICTLVIDLPVNPSSDDPDSENCGACIIPDLSEDKRFHDRPFVTGTPFARFYVGAPIKSPKGIHIGSYCILDDQPRKGITRTELYFLKDAANAVMVHLELTWAREERQRGERMVQGIGSFNDGMSTLRDRSFSLKSPGLDDRIDTLSSWEREQSSNVEQEKISTSSNAPAKSPITLDTTDVIEATPIAISQDELTELRKIDIPSRQGINRGASFEVGRTEAHSSSISNEAVFSHNLVLKDALLPAGVKSTFARAANVIRESVEVEGAIFFDASVTTQGGLVHTSNGMDSSDTDYPLSIRPRMRNTNNHFTNQSTSVSGVFAFSMPQVSSIKGDAVPHDYQKVPERMVQWLLKRYPKGKIFLFRVDGSLSPELLEEEAQNTKKKIAEPHTSKHSLSKSKASGSSSLQNEADFLLEIFPGARCIALTPLWDAHRERFFSLGFVWTNNPRRVLTVESDLSYLTAFGNTMMAEIARLDSMAAKKAKADLLGSISHELRSPLHGILASVELLEDSTIVPFQASLINSIDICGRTLLDTIDHLLDYSKINHVSEKARHSRRAARQIQRPNATGLQSAEQATEQESAIHADIDLGAITEEVIVAVSVGHEIKVPAKSTTINSNGQMGSLSNGETDAKALRPHVRPKIERRTSQFDHVTISIDINSSSDWKLCTEAGAWRRIVMNLYGNSLKYCEQGFINVTLKSEPMQSNDSQKRSMVTLNVTDSGKGMSEEYLRDQLFKPFAQENPLAPGTGLGLSIIRQIIVLLGGEIVVKSKKDIGTDIRVSIPMVHSKQPFGNMAAPILDEILKVRESTRGLSVSLLGIPEESKNEAQADTGIESGLWSHQFNHMRSALESLCTNWFGMCLNHLKHPDLYLIGENSHNFADLKSGRLLDQLHEEMSPNVGNRLLQVIVLCKTAFSASNLERNVKQSRARRIVVFISQPCGPRKLAKALSLCLARRAEMLSGNSRAESEQVGPEIDKDEILSGVRVGHVVPEEVELIGSKLPLRDHDQISSPRFVEKAHLTAKPDTKTEISQQHSKTMTDSSQVPAAPNAHPSEPFLLVDDNHINLQVLTMYMKKNKYAYATAKDGLEAFDTYRAASVPFKTVFMDVSMPVMDGLTSTRNIRTWEHENKMPPCSIIVLTGLGSASVQQEAYSSGANLLLVKPVRLKEIGRVLAEANEEKSKAKER